MMARDLTARVQNNQAARTGTGPSLSDDIKRMESSFAMAMPRGNEATQLIRDALTCLRTTPKLAEWLVQHGKIRIGEFGFLQGQNVGLLLIQPRQHLRQAHFQRINVPGRNFNSQCVGLHKIIKIL